MGERFKYQRWKEGVEPLPTTPQEDFVHKMELFYPAETSTSNPHPTGKLQQLLKGKPQTLR